MSDESNQTSAPSNYVADNEKATPNPSVKKSRVWEIDFLRGICVILMILDHLAILLAEYFGKSWYGNLFYAKGNGDAFTRFCVEWVRGDARAVIHPIVLFVFFAISGMSCSFSRSNAKRGLQLALVALIYSLCSYAIQELGIDGVFVSFGVLHFLAVSILLYAFIVFIFTPRGNPLSAHAIKRGSIKTDKSPSKVPIMISSAIIIIVTACLYFLYTPPATTPKFFAIVFPPKDFYGNASLFYSQAEISPGDLFTLVPYLAFFFAGTLIAPILYPKRRSLLPCLDRAWQKPISFVGRHALIIYIAHVILLAGILALLSYLFITPGSWGF